MTKSLTRRRLGGVPSSRRTKAFTAVVLASLGFAGAVSAQVTADATAKVQYESNSNVFNLSNAPLIPGATYIRRSDNYIAEGGTFDLYDLVGRQNLYLSGSAVQYHYDHLTDIDHTDYKVDAGANWTLTSMLTGNIDATRTRAMTSFLDTSSTSLSLTTDQRESAQASLKIATDWRLDGAAFTHTTDQSQPNGPETRLSEQSGTTALHYLGFGDFSSGVDAGYITGSYTGGPSNSQPSYHQVSFDLLGSYKASGRSAFSGTVGYSDRVSANGLNKTSGVTGDINFQDQLTPKSSVTLDVRRAINNYLTTASSEIDTSVQVGGLWHATFKLDVALGYTFTYRDFPSQTTRANGDPIGAQRVDIDDYVTLALNYHPTRWLDVKAYANLLARRSDAPENDFHATIYGVSFVVKTAKPPGRR